MAAKGGQGVSTSTDKKATKNRYDVFKNAKPYYGSPILGADGQRVPALFILCAHTVMVKEIPFTEMKSVPPVLKSKLEHYKRYEVYKGPRVMKCSACGKFYTNEQKFQVHACN